MDEAQESYVLNIRLCKNIPVGGGLGGGSSDAAIILKTMNSIAGAPLASDKLRKIASRLGADVSFFLLDSNSAIGSGIGDELRPVDVPQKWYVLATPSFGVNTKWAYENSVLTSREPGTILNGSKVFATSYWHNDFEAKVFKKYPELARIKQAFIESGSEASMLSGSGSTVFGVFSSKSKAGEALDLIQKSDKNLRVFIAKALS
jgi:4-diphosphocytidyl-2-C-methyl-D-erythritol kinase